MVKNIIIGLALTVSGQALAKTKMPDIKRWVKGVTPNVKSEMIIQKVLFVDQKVRNIRLGCQ